MQWELFRLKSISAWTSWKKFKENSILHFPKKPKSLQYYCNVYLYHILAKFSIKIEYTFVQLTNWQNTENNYRWQSMQRFVWNDFTRVGRVGSEFGDQCIFEELLFRGPYSLFPTFTAPHCLIVVDGSVFEVVVAVVICQLLVVVREMSTVVHHWRQLVIRQLAALALQLHVESDHRHDEDRQN